jgi:hypothetical protein
MSQPHRTDGSSLPLRTDEARDDVAPASSAPDAILHHDDDPGLGDHIGEAAGGISGVLTGAALGAAGGPLGTIIGGVAGAVGGWWAGRTVSEAATQMTRGGDSRSDDDRPGADDRRLHGRGSDDVLAAYRLGHLAGLNPDYAGRDFEAVEHELERGWKAAGDARLGTWPSVRGHARDAFARSRALHARPVPAGVAGMPRER